MKPKPLLIFFNYLVIFLIGVTIVLIIYTLFSCSLFLTPDDPPVIIHEDPPPEDPPEEPTTGPVVFALYKNNTLSFFDGITTRAAYTGAVVFAHPRILAIDDVLYHFDEYGNVLKSEWLPVYPEAVAVYNDDIYTLERIDPETAYNLGAMYKEYTRIFQNNTEIGAWYLNEWRVKSILILDNGDLIALDTGGAYHTISGHDDYWKAYNAGIGIYEFNPTYRTAYISDSSGDYFTNWSTNSFNSARWQKSNNTWYSNNGYEWTPGELFKGELLENNNALQNFTSPPYPVDLPNGEPPTVIPATSRFENSESVTYWIECNSGYLLRHIPSLDKLEIIVRLYTGDGQRSTGISMASYIEPVRIKTLESDLLYFHDEGGVMKYDFNSGLISIFSQEMEIMRW